MNAAEFQHQLHWLPISQWLLLHTTLNKVKFSLPPHDQLARILCFLTYNRQYETPEMKLTTCHTMITILTLAAEVLAKSERSDCAVIPVVSPSCGPSMLLRRAIDAAVVKRRRLWSAGWASPCSSSLWASVTGLETGRLLTAGDVDGERPAYPATGSDCRYRDCTASAMNNNNNSNSN